MSSDLAAQQRPLAPCFELGSKQATSALARRLRPVVRGGDLIVVSGPLGAGKTFFVRALCRALGLPRDVAVTSPTFALSNEHATEPPMCHADLYRLSSREQVFELGLDAQRDDGRLLVVEWGEPFIDVLGGDALVVELELDPRRATLRAEGHRAEQMLGEILAGGAD